MKNVGGIDRIVRIIAGIALLAVALVPSEFQTPWAWIGVIPLGTALIGWCPLYTVLGIRTCPVSADGSEAGESL